MTVNNLLLEISYMANLLIITLFQLRCIGGLYFAP